MKNDHQHFHKRHSCATARGAVMECDDCSAWDSAHFYKVETEERQGQAAGGHATCQVIRLRVVASLLSRRTHRRSVLTRLVARELWSRILLDVRWPSGR